MNKRFPAKNRSAKRPRRRRVLERLEARRLLAGAGPELVRPISDLTIEAGVPFTFDAQPSGAVAFGFDVGGIDLRATDNYFASNVSFLKHFQDVTFTGNTVINQNPWRVTQLNELAEGFQPSENYTWDNNSYHSNNPRPFILDGGSKTWDQWRSETGLDGSSDLVSASSGTLAVVRPNAYEPGRGHAIVYNWDRLDQVMIDLLDVVDLGATYRIYNVLNLKGDPLVSGVFDGSPVAVPMDDTASPIPIGHTPAAPLKTGKEFGAFLILSDADPVAASGTEFYVSPTGTPDGDGSLENPWDLQTAMSHPSSVQPGDTIWLKGGTYFGAFTSQLAGTAEAPIHVREFPGEEAIIDLNNGSPLRSEVITIEGQHTHFEGFEIFSSDPSARLTDEAGSWPVHVNRGNINVYGDHVKFINLEIHDLNKGLGFWSQASGGEVYGSLIYNNGWIGPDRDHGHALYSQNDGDMRRFVDNMMFNQFRNGVKVYGSVNASLKNHFMEGNVAFNNGAAEGEGFSGNFQILIGGGQLAENIELKQNFTYVGSRYFAHDDADTLTLSARQAGGDPLPSWLTFYASEGFFVGSPGAGDVGTVSVELTATDPSGLSVTEVFNITVRQANVAPHLVSGIDSTQVAAHETFHLPVADHFADTDPQDSLEFSAALQDGGVLPPWVSIDPQTGVITGKPPESGTYGIEVTAYDDGGKFVTTTFELTVSPDTAPPQLMLLEPQDNSTDVAVNTDLNVEFDEEIQRGAGNIVIQRVSDDETVQTIDVQSDQVSVSGSQLRIDPAVDLDPTTEYVIQIYAGSVLDMAGNPFAGITDMTTWSFTTATPPTVSSIVINGGDPQRSSITNLTTTFSSQVEIDWESGDPFQFVNTTTGQIVTDTPVVSVVEGVTVVQFTFAPGPSVTAAGSLKDGNYQLLIDASRVTRNGLQLDGDGDGTGGDSVLFLDSFYRKFGDQNGNGLVDLLDFVKFRRAFGQSISGNNYVQEFDSDGDDWIDLTDFAEFRRSFGH